jgi:hypothetical protein
VGSFGDKFWDWTSKISPPQQTISDDARSRIARREQLERTRMTRVEHDPETGEKVLWYTITVSSLGGHTNVPVPWSGTSEEDARASFIEWLGQDEFQTVDFTSDGKDARLTFRGSWVSGFTMDGKGRARP